MALPQGLLQVPQGFPQAAPLGGFPSLVAPHGLERSLHLVPAQEVSGLAQTMGCIHDSQSCLKSILLVSLLSADLCCVNPVFDLTFHHRLDCIGKHLKQKGPHSLVTKARACRCQMSGCKSTLAPLHTIA